MSTLRHRVQQLEERAGTVCRVCRTTLVCLVCEVTTQTGYDLTKLTTEELDQLQALYQKMEVPHTP